MELLLKDHPLFSDIYLEPCVLQSCLLATSVVESSSSDFLKLKCIFSGSNQKSKVIDHDFSLFTQRLPCVEFFQTLPKSVFGKFQIQQSPKSLTFCVNVCLRLPTPPTLPLPTLSVGSSSFMTDTLKYAYVCFSLTYSINYPKLS